MVTRIIPTKGELAHMLNLKQDVYSVKEAFLILKSYGLTKNEQIVRRWIRGEVPGKKLKSIAPPNNATKIGHKIKREYLEEFILKHTKPDIVIGSNNIVTRTERVDVQKKEEIEKLIEENALLMMSNNKSNKNSNKKRILTEAEIEKVLEDKYQEVKSNKLFADLTEDALDKLLYTLASQFADGVAADHEIKMLKEQIEELNLLACKTRVTTEDRMVLKGLGVSIGEIIKNLPVKEDDVRRLEVLGTSRDSIKIKFYYNKSYYSAEVRTRIQYLRKDEKANKWTVNNMVKSTTNKPVRDSTLNKIIHSAVKQTFEKLYDLEQKKNKSFYYCI